MPDAQELNELRPLREWQKKAKAPRAFAVPAHEDFAPMVQWMEHAAAHITQQERALQAKEDGLRVRDNRIASLQRREEMLREALEPLAFLTMGLDEDEGAQFTTQEVWEEVKENRFKDWIDYDDIERARQALEDTDNA